MINPLRYVTKKLQHQSLNESANKENKVTSEDRDSGTESDDEQTFDESEIASEMSSEVSSGCSVRSRPTSQTSTDTLTCEDLPMGEDSQDMPPPTSSHALFHLRRITRQSQHHYLLRAPSNSSSNSATRESPTGGDTFGVSDYDATDPVEHHSSEEELETLTGSWGRESGPPSEKRKWSQVARLSLTDSGSSDDEVCVLTTGTRPPVEFRTSPPLEAHKPQRSISPPSKMLTLSSSSSSLSSHQRQPIIQLPSVSGIRSLAAKEELTSQGAEGGGVVAPIMNGGRGESGARASSPRKRHRHTPRPYRPCLDFEKMQQMKNRAVTQWRNGGELSLSFF